MYLLFKVTMNWGTVSSPLISGGVVPIPPICEIGQLGDRKLNFLEGNAAWKTVPFFRETTLMF